MKPKFNFNIKDKFYKKQKVGFKYRCMYNDPKEELINVDNDSITKLLYAPHDKRFLEHIEITDLKSEINLDAEPQKIEALKLLEVEFIKGHKKGVEYYNKQLKDTLQGLYINSSERCKDEFLFYYYSKAYKAKQSSLNNLTIRAYLIVIPINFNELTMYTYGFYNGIQNKLIEFAKSKFKFDNYLKPEYKSTPQSVKNRLINVYYEAKFLNNPNIGAPKDYFKDHFKEITEAYKNCLEVYPNEIQNLNTELYNLLNHIEAEYKPLENQSFFIEFKNTISDKLEKKRKPQQQKPIINNFFKNVNSEQLEQIKEVLKDLEGKNLAMFISLGVNEFNFLKLENHSKSGLSQKTFIEMQDKRYQSVNKYLDNQYDFNGNNEDQNIIKNQLNTILK